MESPNNHRGRIADLARPAPIVDMDTRVRQVQELLRGQSPLVGVVVVRDRRPQGLIMGYHLDRCLSTEFGRALFLNRAIAEIMDARPLMVDADAHLEQVALQAMNREDERLYDQVLVLCHGELLGTVSVQVLVTRMAEAQGVLQLAGGVAHELNQPLQVLLGYVDWLAHRMKATGNEPAMAALMESINQITSISRRLQTLTTAYSIVPYLNHEQIVALHDPAEGHRTDVGVPPPKDFSVATD